jgi:hypothetical protein
LYTPTYLTTLLLIQQIFSTLGLCLSIGICDHYLARVAPLLLRAVLSRPISVILPAKKYIVRLKLAETHHYRCFISIKLHSRTPQT